ncbi:LysE family translocator [Vibrio agarivorans]|uniref:LysE family translocator n=1 Tax=Vibrio agarivorans TaxID=153622 RepID=UPI00222F5D25|nr:LysE family translocator [Vibrio agarivorans]
MEHFFSIILFAISASITPGPNNIMVMTSGANFGAKRTLPLLTGICIGFTLMLLLVGLGFSTLFEQFPSLHLIIKCVGVAYLLYLAWLIAHSQQGVEQDEKGKPLSFIKGALFQWVNAKAWIVATGAIAAFTSGSENFLSQVMTIAGTFFVVSFPCVAVWLLFGSMLQSALTTTESRKRFNVAMSLLLVVSVFPVAKEAIETLL